MISLRPEDLINSSLPNFSELIKDLTKESQDICREIRKKGRNKIHALKCRKKSRDEVSRLQVSQRALPSDFKILICVVLFRSRWKWKRRKEDNYWKTTGGSNKIETKCISFT